jgi:hypothetical protein
MVPVHAALILGAQILGSPAVPIADGVPRLDVEATCRAAHPLTADDRAPYRNCMDDQTRARATLERGWAGFPAPAKDRCTREATLGGSPSYVELLTCLELARDTRIDADAPEPVTPGRALDGARTR